MNSNPNILILKWELILVLIKGKTASSTVKNLEFFGTKTKSDGKTNSVIMTTKKKTEVRPF